MKKTAILLLLVIVLAANAYARSDAEQSYLRDFPRTTWSYFGKSDIPGLYEVLAGNNLLYYHPPTSSLFFGEIWRHGESVTMRRKKEIDKWLAKGAEHKRAIRMGSGKNVVIEVSNPDCPYCRAAHRYFAGRDVTRYVYLYDATGDTAAIKRVLCSAAPEKALDRAYSGLEVITPVEEGCEDRLDDHFRFALKKGVMVTPTFFIDGERVDGFDRQRLDALLNP